MNDFTLSWNMDGMQVGHRIVLTHICGNRRIHAYVSCTTSGSRRLFFSTLNPSDLHISCAWQERKILRDAPAEGMDYYPLKLYKMRWAIETNYYEQKAFWSLNAYGIRRQNGIEHGKPRSQQTENAAVSGRAFCEVPKRQSTRAAKPYKLANTA